MKKFDPEITRIKLTPEQAVLTCCNSSDKGFAGKLAGQQCSSAPPCGLPLADAISS